MTRDDLLDAMREALLSRRRVRVSRVDFEPALDAVLDEVRRQVLPVVASEWCGYEVLKRIADLRGNGPVVAKVGAGRTNIGKVEE